MSIRFHTVLNRFPDMEASLQSIDGKSISVGVKGEHAWLASIHEYGCRIRITPKMRTWLHANGFHVKDTTTEIVIPERSFLRSGFDECHERVVNRAERWLSQVMAGVVTEEEMFQQIGELLRDSIQDYAEDLRTPPKHPFTLQRHPNKENPLVQTGDMINSIEFEVNNGEVTQLQQAHR